MTRNFMFNLAICSTTAVGGLASAETVELYGDKGGKLFKYMDFSPSGVVTDSDGSLVIAAEKDSDGSNGIFGILGRNVPDAPVKVDASTHQLRVEYKFLEGNEADMFKVVLTDQDDGGGGEQYKFDITPDDMEANETSDGFSERLISITEDDADHRTGGKDAGFSKDGDGEANYDLTQWQVQSVWGSSGALMVEIRSIQIVEIEP